MTYPSYAEGYSEAPPPPPPSGTLEGPAGPASRVTLQAHPGNLNGTGSMFVGVTATTSVIAPVPDVYAAAIDRSGAVLTLSAQERVEVQPGTLYAQAGGGVAGGTLYFFLDNSSTFFASTYLDEVGSGRAWLPINGLAVGTHVLKASQTITPPATGVNFYVARANVQDPTYTPFDPPRYDRGNVPVNKWVFQAYDFSDVNSIATHEFEVNPDSVEQTFGNHEVNTEATTVGNGQVIYWEGSHDPVEWSWSGRVLTEDQHDVLKAWGVTSQRVYLTDHFDRRFLVKILSVTFGRVRDVNRPWHMTYEMTAAVLSGDGIVL